MTVVSLADDRRIYNVQPSVRADPDLVATGVRSTEANGRGDRVGAALRVPNPVCARDDLLQQVRPPLPHSRSMVATPRGRGFGQNRLSEEIGLKRAPLIRRQWPP